MSELSTEYTELQRLLNAVLAGDSAEPLETYLTQHSYLPGPRMNSALVETFGRVVETLVQHDIPADRLETLLDRWAALVPSEAPSNDPREILPSAAIAAYGHVAAARPEWWGDEITKIRRAVNDSRWRVRETAVSALQTMLDADWKRACTLLIDWASGGTVFETRAAAAAVAETRLLENKEQAEDALSVQAEAVSRFMNIPLPERRAESPRALRQTLGTTLSIVTVASPETGFHLLEELAALPDPDIRWIVKENTKKQRLQPWQDRLATLEVAMFRPEDVTDE